MIRRRAALGLGMAASAAAPAWGPAWGPAWAPAWAQGRAQGCAGPGLVLEGPATAGAVTVFGHAFPPGAIRSGSGLAVAAGGRESAGQIDVKTRHPDGSAWFAVIAIACPAMAAGARLSMTLRAGPATAAPLPPALLAGRSAILEFRAGGAGVRHDLLALFASANDPWQAGPLAWQARVAMPLPGAASLRLVADVALRTDGGLLVDAWFRNDGAMRPNGREVAYSARLLIDGRIVLDETIARQHQYTGWGRLVGVGPLAAHVRPDAAVLAEAGAVARYGVATGVEDSALAGFAQAMAAPAWRVPLDARGITRDMRQTGGRSDIGPATLSQAAWLISGDRRAGEFAIGQAEAAGAIPWQFWDGAVGGWLTPARWPGLWTDGRGGLPPGGLAQPIAGDTGWVTDGPHQPELSFVPFLLTGRRAFLDNIQAQAAWAVLSHWPAAAARGVASAPGLAEGVNVVRGNQVRGAAWAMRQLEHAAWSSPERDPGRAWFVATAAANWRWMEAQLPIWTRQQGETHGRIPGEYGSPGLMPPWQQDQFASTAILAARRGSAPARAVLAWMANFLVGRFTSAAKGFPPRDGCAYLLAVGPVGTPRSWAELAAATRAAGLSNGNGWAQSQGDYAQLAVQSLAGIAEVLDMPTALRARDALLRDGAPFTGPADYRRDPIYNIVPRCA